MDPTAKESHQNKIGWHRHLYKRTQASSPGKGSQGHLRLLWGGHRMSRADDEDIKETHLFLLFPGPRENQVFQ